MAEVIPKVRTPIRKKGNGRDPAPLPVPMNADQKKMLDKQFHTLADAIVSRAYLADKLGKSYWPSSGGAANRKLYEALGYEQTPTFSSYYARYRRQDIAKAVVNALPEACWRMKPTIADSAENDTKFEKELASIIRQKRVWHYLSRADKISGIGQFGVVLMGFDDGTDLKKPLTKAGKLLYLRPYTQEFVTIDKYVENSNNERYGLPEYYTIRVSQGETKDRKSLTVHWTRIIHISEGLVEDDLFGTPRLECVLNRLQDLELVSGGSAEMSWRGAFPGYAFSAQPDAVFDDEALEDLEEEIQNYLHGLERYIRMQGIDIKELQPQVSDPSKHVDVLITLISAASRIPKRILLGSERGELASSQDERSWLDRIDERREGYVEPGIVRPFIDTLIRTEVVPAPPSNEYSVSWPPLLVTGEKEMMEVAKSATEAVSKYYSTPGLSDMIPVEMYLKKFLGWSDDEVRQAKETLGKKFEEEREEEEIPEEEEGLEE